MFLVRLAAPIFAFRFVMAPALRGLLRADATPVPQLLGSHNSCIEAFGRRHESRALDSERPIFWTVLVGLPDTVGAAELGRVSSAADADCRSGSAAARQARQQASTNEAAHGADLFATERRRHHPEDHHAGAHRQEQDRGMRDQMPAL